VYTSGVKLPHLGKPLGGVGKSLVSPTCSTTAIPVAIWYRKWQCRNQYPETEVSLEPVEEKGDLQKIEGLAADG
jgi:hypothetical protein